MKQLIEKAKQVLNSQELGYFQLMLSQYMVLFIKARPGTWKSAILKSISDKMGMIFIDLRLPTMDEVDLGTLPAVHYDNGLPIVKSGIPEWAYMTKDKTKNFLIVFEELNRTSPAVRNAALGLLLERRIGSNFVFGDNVYMAATGNLGTEDGTDVEEFDNALKSRLISVNHEHELHHWIDAYATENIHSDIVEYLKAKPTSFYPDLKEQGGDVITNPRTWTGLSKAIEANFGKTSTYQQYGDFLRKFGHNFVGARNLDFIRFLEENILVTFPDILAGKADLKKIKRDNQAELAKEFSNCKIADLTKKEMTNLIKFLHMLRETNHDVLVGAIYQLGINRIAELEATKKASANETALMKEFEKEYIMLGERETNEIQESNTETK